MSDITKFNVELCLILTDYGRCLIRSSFKENTREQRILDIPQLCTVIRALYDAIQSSDKTAYAEIHKWKVTICFLNGMYIAAFSSRNDSSSQNKLKLKCFQVLKAFCRLHQDTLDQIRMNDNQRRYESYTAPPDDAQVEKQFPQKDTDEQFQEFDNRILRPTFQKSENIWSIRSVLEKANTLYVALYEPGKGIWEQDYSKRGHILHSLCGPRNSELWKTIKTEIDSLIYFFVQKSSNHEEDKMRTLQVEGYELFICFRVVRLVEGPGVIVLYYISTQYLEKSQSFIHTLLCKKRNSLNHDEGKDRNWRLKQVECQNALLESNLDNLGKHISKQFPSRVSSIEKLEKSFLPLSNNSSPSSSSVPFVFKKRDSHQNETEDHNTIHKTPTPPPPPPNQHQRQRPTAPPKSSHKTSFIRRTPKNKRNTVQQSSTPTSTPLPPKPPPPPPPDPSSSGSRSSATNKPKFTRRIEKLKENHYQQKQEEEKEKGKVNFLSHKNQNEGSKDYSVLRKSDDSQSRLAVVNYRSDEGS